MVPFRHTAPTSRLEKPSTRVYSSPKPTHPESKTSGVLNCMPQKSMARRLWSAPLSVMFYVVLYQPEIPPNTGNIIRLCANIGAGLHLIRPLGFHLDERRLRRAGLDYHEWTEVREHDTLDAFEAQVRPSRVFALSTRAERCYSEESFASGDAFLFGPETRGLPDTVLRSLPASRRLRIPMRPGNRSLNLANAVAVVCYEAWRQQSFRIDHQPGKNEQRA